MKKFERTQEQKELDYAEGEQAELEIINAIKNAQNSTLHCDSSKNSYYWTPYVDLVAGDIYVSYSTKEGRRVVKRLDSKKNGWVTVSGTKIFGNCDEHYYVIWNGTIETSWVISAMTVKKLVEALENSKWIKPCPRSGEASINLNDYDRMYNFRKKIPLKRFIEMIDE